ncbi:hypothetical protein [Hymenobacter sp. YC55]|nr:hypothetical protein [Hymenobacter sp. YC55]MDF7813325.1 hypothetical protein [Hymenobacter sp. YC55]
MLRTRVEVPTGQGRCWSGRLTYDAGETPVIETQVRLLASLHLDK